MNWARGGLLAFLAFWTAGLATGAATGSVLDLVNLAFHEAGHLFLAPFGTTAHFLGGTLGQLAVPASLAVYFLVRRRQPYSAAVCSWWAGENLIDVAVYMADARTLRLDLVGGGEHDWNTLFYQFGLLGEESVARVSAATHAVGVVLMSAALAWALCALLPAPARERIAAALRDGGPAVRYLLEPE